MALCGGASKCGCAFASSSLVLSGTGDRSNPLNLETYEGVVTVDTDIPSPFLGQRIYETTTGRFKVYNGTNWVIYGGNWPGFQLERQAVQSIPDGGSGDTVDFLTEIYDTDGFHVASSDTVTIPSGLGGDYLIAANGAFAANATGYRILRITFANNTVVSQNNNRTVGGVAMINTINNGFAITDLFRLEPGATLTLLAYQTSGGPLDLTTGQLKGIMMRHDPSYT